MTTYEVATSIPILHILGYVLVGAALLILVYTIFFILKDRKRQSRSRPFYTTFIVLFIVLFGIGLSFFFTTGSNSSIIVQKGEITVSGQFIGNNTYTTGEIKSAFEENINSGNITLSNRNIGTSAGSINEGKFTLSNGASAYVVSDNQEDLIVLLDSGLYLVLGPTNLSAFASDFSSNVYSVTGS